MKKSILLLCLLFFSCFDILHYMELNADKKFHSEYRIRFSKMLFSMAQSQGASPLNDFNMDELIKKLESNFPNSKISGEKKETDSALTYHIKYDGTEIPIAKKYSTDLFPIVPYKDEFNQYVILFVQKQDTTSGVEGNMMAEAILSGPVYRMIFGGELKPKQASLVTGTDKSQLEILQLGSQYLIEFPINIVLKGNSAVVISFQNETKITNVQNYLKQNLKVKPSAKDEL